MRQFIPKVYEYPFFPSFSKVIELTFAIVLVAQRVLPGGTAGSALALHNRTYRSATEMKVSR
jgi:hypothetical protein